MSKKLTPTLRREILEKAALGSSAREIAAWLAAERGVKVSHQAVGNALRQVRTERADVAKAVVREVLVKTVGGDLAHLDELLGDLRARRQRAAKAIDEFVLNLKRQREEGAAGAAGVRGKRRRAGAEAPGEGDGEEPDIETALVWGRLYTKIAELEIKAIDRRLHYSGAGPDEGEKGAKAATIHVCLPPESDE